MKDKVLDAIRRAWAWIGGDGVQHFAVSAIIVFIIGAFAPLWVAFCVALAIGLLKELLDYGRTDDRSAYDWRHSILHDFVCDGAGALFGLILCVIWLNIK